jgi:Na+-translocating ferredoxin:NAD+ oxidoreductase RNF subunit RnfB
MIHNTTHRALEIQHEVCIGCSHCIKVCPTEALRVSGGKALLYADWCIDCGECFRICPNRAIRVVDDDFQRIYDYSYRVLLVPAVFYAQFEESIPRNTINQILSDLGFSEICTVEQSVDSLVSEINKYVQESKEKPVISSFCPAVIRLIQVRFPALIDKIMLLIPPLEVTAQYYKRKFEAEGRNEEDLGLFYLTPCIGKIAAVKSPVGGYVSPLNGVINMDYIYNKVLLAYKNKNYGTSYMEVNSEISSKGALWPTTGGEAACIEGRSLAIDGMQNVIEFLEKLENDEIEDGVDYLELRGCDESCAGGILLQNNRFLIADYLRRIAKKYPETHNLQDEYNKFCSAYIHMDEVEPRSMVKYDKNIDKAIKKMEMAHRIRTILPDIDCGACGAPSCEALAADIVRDDASLNNCIFMQARFEKEGSLPLLDAISLMENVWGKDRFINKEREEHSEDKE